MARHLYLLVVVFAVFCPAAAYVSDRDQIQHVNDVLTEKLFTVSSLLTTIEQHVQQLESWDGSAGAIESRLTAIEAGQQSTAKQLVNVMRRLEDVYGDTAAVRSDVAEVAASQASSTAALTTLRSDLTEAISGVDGSVSGLVGSQATQHEQTRGVCREGGAAQLLEPLTELREAVSQSSEMAGQTQTALSGGLERLDGHLQETTEKLEELGQELRDERQARLTATTPAPTMDPRQALLNSLAAALRKRRGD